jgi:hypothetical protein
MAKVFAVIKEGDKLTLKTWPSASAMHKDGFSFFDEQFIATASTSDYKDGMYNEPVEQPVGFGVVHSDDRLAALNMLHEALKAHFKGKTFEAKRY